MFYITSHIKKQFKYNEISKGVITTFHFHLPSLIRVNHANPIGTLERKVNCSETCAFQQVNSSAITQEKYDLKKSRYIEAQCYTYHLKIKKKN
jgi:hypothetical protein